MKHRLTIRFDFVNDEITERWDEMFAKAFLKLALKFFTSVPGFENSNVFNIESELDRLHDPPAD